MQSVSNDASIVGAVIAVVTLLQTVLIQLFNKNVVKTIRSNPPPVSAPLYEVERRRLIREIVEEVMNETERRRKTLSEQSK